MIPATKSTKTSLRSGPCLDVATRILAAAEARLQSSKHAPLRQIRCDVRDVMIVLTDVVTSYYLKQLAQTTILRIGDDYRVENRLRVEKC